jgi:hypothetical protein
MKRDELTIWEFLVHWGDPFTDPPDGQPRVIARTRVTVPRDAGAPEPPPDILHAWEAANRAFVERFAPSDRPRWPWFIAVSRVQETRRRQSDRAKYARRLTYLVRRMEKRYPLVAETMIRAALMQKPDYYGMTAEEARRWTLGGAT